MKKIKYLLITAFILVFSVSVYAGSQQVSSTTASTIITYARWHLDETTENFWDDDELLVYLNKGSMDIAARTRCLESTEDITLSASTIEYSITSTYIDVVTVIYTDSDGGKKGLIRKNPQSVGNAVKSVLGEPVYWYEWAGKIGAYPTLSAWTSEIITIYYVASPSAVAATGNVAVPAIYDKALVYYITAQAYLKERQFAKSARFIAEYYAELERYRKDFVDRPQEPESNLKRIP